MTNLGGFNIDMEEFKGAKPVVPILRPPKSYMLVRFEKKK